MIATPKIKERIVKGPNEEIELLTKKEETLSVTANPVVISGGSRNKNNVNKHKKLINNIVALFFI